jgi:hypothetical protein
MWQALLTPVVRMTFVLGVTVIKNETGISLKFKTKNTQYIVRKIYLFIGKYFWMRLHLGKEETS